nr:dihydroorotase [Oscillospiraceae bacterium]
APHSAEEKSKGLAGSAFGIVGIESAFQLIFTHLVKKNIISLEKAVELLAINPRKRFNIPLGDDCTVWNLNEKTVINPDEFLSMGKSTPFENEEVYGKCLLTVCGGKTVYKSL